MRPQVHQEPDGDDEELDAAITRLAAEALDLQHDQSHVARAFIHLQWSLRDGRGRKRPVDTTLSLSVPMREDPISGLAQMIAELARQMQLRLIENWPEAPQD